MIQPLAHGEKAVFVSNFNTKTVIHMRLYFGESEKKFPTCCETTLTTKEFLDLVNISAVIQTEYERLECPNSRNSDMFVPTAIITDWVLLLMRLFFFYLFFFYFFLNFNCENV